MAEGDASRSLRFALAKFRPATLPATLVTRSVLRDQLTAGAGQRLTMVVGSAGAGKSVLLSSWTATRPPGVKAHLRSVYRKLGVTSRSQAIERAVDLRLL